MYISDPPSIGQLNDLSVLEGLSVNVTCPFTSGNPSVTNVSWTRDVDKTIWPSGELYVHQLKREDDGIYECLASNTMNPSCENKTKGIVSKSFHLEVVCMLLLILFTSNYGNG